MPEKPLIPEDLQREIMEDVLKKSSVLRMLKWPPPKPRPWYRRVWQRVDRYLPRVKVYLGPLDSCDGDHW